MNLSKWSEADRLALQRFYSASGHLWSWEEMQSGTTPAARAATEWLEASPPPQVYPALLPRADSSAGSASVMWYAVAFSESQAESLRNELRAFLGPVGTDFDGRRADLNPQDPPEAVLAAWAQGPWVYRLRVIDASRKDWIRSALERLRSVWNQRPSHPATLFRTTEALLREFHASLVTGDERAARRWLEELRAGGRLSAENVLFLEVERLAALGRWGELLLHPQWSLLQQIRRPRQVTARMIEAIWRERLARFASHNDPTGAAAYFREHVWPENGPLFRQRGQASARPVVLAFLLATATAPTPHHDRARALLALIPNSAEERLFAEAVVALIPLPGKEKPIGAVLQARSAVEGNDYETAWELLRAQPASPESTRLLLECAYELGSPEAAREVQGALASLSKEEQEKLFRSKRYRLIWEELQRLLTASPEPTDWEEWLQRLDAHPEWTEAVLTARQGAGLWSVDPYRDRPARVQAIAAKLLADRPIPAARSLRLALPYLIGFFLQNGYGIPEFRVIYKDLLMLLALSEDFSGQDFALVQTLVDALFEAGMTVELYHEALQSCEALWHAHGGPNRLDWALEILDTLAASPALVPYARDSFFNTVRASFQQNHRRVRQDQWKLFEWLCRDLGRLEDFAAVSPTAALTEGHQDILPDQDALAGKLVAIYTLTESAAQRAKAIIQDMYEGVDVRLNHELDGSSQLKALARQADWFIVATRSAKHAATEFIKAERPATKSSLLYPPGKGASSIVRVLLTALGA